MELVQGEGDLDGFESTDTADFSVIAYAVAAITGCGALVVAKKRDKPLSKNNNAVYDRTASCLRETGRFSYCAGKTVQNSVEKGKRCAIIYMYACRSGGVERKTVRVIL